MALVDTNGVESSPNWTDFALRPALLQSDSSANAQVPVTVPSELMYAPPIELNGVVFSNGKPFPGSQAGRSDSIQQSGVGVASGQEVAMDNRTFPPARHQRPARHWSENLAVILAIIAFGGMMAIGIWHDYFR